MKTICLVYDPRPAVTPSSSLFGSLLVTPNSSKTPVSMYSASTSALFTNKTVRVTFYIGTTCRVYLSVVAISVGCPCRHLKLYNPSFSYSQYISNCTISSGGPYILIYPDQLSLLYPLSKQINSDQDPKSSALVDAVMSDDPAVTTERAYVPPAQRQPIDVIDDSIVVVGQARQKKRKRAKPFTQDADSPAKANDEDISSAEWVERIGDSAKKPKRRQNASTGDSLEPFDYSKVSNILDDVPIPEQDHGKRKKKQNQGTHCCIVYVYVYVVSIELIDILNENRGYSLR